MGAKSLMHAATAAHLRVSPEQLHLFAMEVHQPQPADGELLWLALPACFLFVDLEV